MKFVYDEKTGQYVPENYLNRLSATKVQIGVFRYLDNNPTLCEECSYSTREVCDRFLMANPSYSVGSREAIRDAIAMWYNEHNGIPDGSAIIARSALNSPIKFDDDDDTTSSTEDCGGAAGAPGMSCGTSGIGGTANFSNNVGGIPSTVGALDIPSPVLPPKQKKKKSSSEAVKEPFFGFNNLRKRYPRRYLMLYYNNNSDRWILLRSYATEEDAKANFKYDTSAAQLPGGGTTSTQLVAPNGTVIMTDKDLTSSVNLDSIPEENKNGDCFTVAWNAFYDNIAQKPLLVHGIVTGQGAIEGIKYNHAWIEIGDMVIDKTIPLFANGFPKDAYYRMARADESLMFKYNSEQVMNNALKFNTYGPWEDVLWQYS